MRSTGYTLKCGRQAEKAQGKKRRIFLTNISNVSVALLSGEILESLGFNY